MTGAATANTILLYDGCFRPPHSSLLAECGPGQVPLLSGLLPRRCVHPAQVDTALSVTADARRASRPSALPLRC